MIPTSTVLSLALAALVLGAGAPSASTPLSAADRVALVRAADDHLASLRGGAQDRREALTPAERAALERARDGAPELAHLRGRGLPDRQMQIAATVVFVLILIVIFS